MPSVIMGLVAGKPFQVVGRDLAEAACRIARLAKISGVMFASGIDGQETKTRAPTPADVRILGRRDYR